MVETNLFLALVGIMVCSLILGMGVPSVVCYLLMATLMVKVGRIRVLLGGPPVHFLLWHDVDGHSASALAGYASASIAEAPIMKTSWAAFRFSLVGFTLPYMFVYRPALLLLAPIDGQLTAFAVIHAVLAALFGILALAAGLAGWLSTRLSLLSRGLLFLSAALLLAPITHIGEYRVGLTIDITGAALFLVIAAVNWQVARVRPAEPDELVDELEPTANAAV
ncbi:MAG: hypothetical protein R3C99_02090 [Pirellulaceae bacterium]